MRLPPKSFLRAIELPAENRAGKNAQALVINGPDTDGEIKRAEEWLAWLEKDDFR